MAELPWFKLYAGDFLFDPKVRTISLEAEGLLVRMWCVCWREGSCPSAPEELAMVICRPLALVEKHIRGCLAFFELREGRLFSPRMERERHRSQTNSKNANKRWAKKSENPEPKNSEFRIQNSERRNAIRIATSIPSPPSGAAAVNFSSLENSNSSDTRERGRYTERDFFERDMRRIRDATEWVDGLLQTQPLLDADEIERLILEHAGITAERYAEVREYQHREPRRPIGKVTGIA